MSYLIIAQTRAIKGTKEHLTRRPLPGTPVPQTTSTATRCILGISNPTQYGSEDNKRKQSITKLRKSKDIYLDRNTEHTSLKLFLIQMFAVTNIVFRT